MSKHLLAFDLMPNLGGKLIPFIVFKSNMVTLRDYMRLLPRLFNSKGLKI